MQEGGDMQVQKSLTLIRGIMLQAHAWCSSCSKVLEKFSSGNDQYVQITERVPSVNCLQRVMCASKVHSDYRYCT